MVAGSDLVSETRLRLVKVTVQKTHNVLQATVKVGPVCWNVEVQKSKVVWRVLHSHLGNVHLEKISSRVVKFVRHLKQDW